MKKYQNWKRGIFCSIGLTGTTFLGSVLWQKGQYIPAGILIALAVLVMAEVFLFAFHTEDFLDTMASLHDAEEGKALFGRFWSQIKKEEALVHRMKETASMSSSAMLLKREAELHALQNQINPHFLYNTLEIIRSKALLQGIDDVAEMTEALGTLFRYYINRPGELATIDEELDNVKNYILIQQYRFPNRFSFRIHVEDRELGILNRLIPVLTIQPVVENAISHGLANCIEGGLIEVYVHLCSDDTIHIVIKDNGVGIDEETLSKMRYRMRNPAPDINVNKIKEKSPGIALDNVNRRIRFYFGEEYGIEIMSTQGVETNVIVQLPNIVM